MAKNEAKVRFTAETGEFNAAIKKSNDEMAELRAELKLNETQMKATGATVEGLEDKHKILSKQLEASEDKTHALSQKLDKATEIFGENSTEASKLRAQLLNAQTAEEKLRQAVNACESELDAQRKATDKTEVAVESLTDKVARQQRELIDLKNEFIDVSARYGDTSDEAKYLEKSINDLSVELKENKTVLADARSKADELDRSFDELVDSASNAGDGFTVTKGILADLASNAIQNVIAKVGEFMSYLKELPAATMELRQNLSTLNTSFDEMGFDVNTAKDTWKELYAVFGDDAQAVEAANHISKLAKNQEDLNKWVTITTGVFGTYQDSLPVEGLAEAANETAKTGKVTGGLADALNWSSEAAEMFAEYMGEDVTTAEDAFNVALSKCTSEQERQKLITDTLTKLYGSAADTYRETAGAQMEAKEATADHMLAENDLASAIEPVTTALTKMKTDIVTKALPAVKSMVNAFFAFSDWCVNHKATIAAIGTAIGIVATAITAYNVVQAVKTAMDAAQVTTVWALVSAHIAQAAAAAAALAPYILIVAAIAAVIAIIVLCIKHWDDIVAAVKNAWEIICNTLSTWGEWINTNVVQPIVNFFKSLWEGLKTIWDNICNVIQVAFMFIGSIISAAFDIITLPYRFIWENCKEYVFAAWEWIKNAVSTAINAVKNVITTVMNAIKSVITTVWNAIKTAVSTAVNAVKSVVSTAWEAIKSVVSNVMNGIKTTVSNVWGNIKSAVSTAVNAVKSTVSNVFNSIKSTASTVWNGIKNAIITPIEAAKQKIKGIIDSIKGFFSNLKLSFPDIKMPHFKITGKFSLDPPSVPKLGIEWYKEGGILTKPTIFGMNGLNLMAGGEAGAEAILPIDKLEGYIANAIEKTANVVNLGSLAAAIEDLANRPIELAINGRQFAVATASDGDSVNGLRNSFKNRGMSIE